MVIEQFTYILYKNQHQSVFNV